jgi:hypothetical protein
MTTPEWRQCRHCELWFPEEPQHYRPFNSRGHVYMKRTCRSCEREYSQQWVRDFPERRAESLRGYCARYPDRRARRAHDYRLAHLGGIHEREARYRDANQERIHERQRLQKQRRRAAERAGDVAGGSG